MLDPWFLPSVRVHRRPHSDGATASLLGNNKPVLGKNLWMKAFPWGLAFAGHWAKIASELPHRSGSQCLSKWKIMMGVSHSLRLYLKPDNGLVNCGGPAGRRRGGGRSVSGLGISSSGWPRAEGDPASAAAALDPGGAPAWASPQRAGLLAAIMGEPGLPRPLSSSFLPSEEAGSPEAAAEGPSQRPMEL